MWIIFDKHILPYLPLMFDIQHTRDICRHLPAFRELTRTHQNSPELTKTCNLLGVSATRSCQVANDKVLDGTAKASPCVPEMIAVLTPTACHLQHQLDVPWRCKPSLAIRIHQGPTRISWIDGSVGPQVQVAWI